MYSGQDFPIKNKQLRHAYACPVAWHFTAGEKVLRNQNNKGKLTTPAVEREGAEGCSRQQNRKKPEQITLICFPLSTLSFEGLEMTYSKCEIRLPRAIWAGVVNTHGGFYLWELCTCWCCISSTLTGSPRTSPPSRDKPQPLELVHIPVSTRYRIGHDLENTAHQSGSHNPLSYFHS